RRQLDPLCGLFPSIRLPTITPAVRTWAGRAGIAAAACVLTAVGLLLLAKGESAPSQTPQPNTVRPGRSAPNTVSRVPGEETPRLWDELRRKEPSRLSKGP